MGFSLPSFPQISSSIRVSFSIFNALMTSFTFWHVDSLIMTQQFMHDHWKLMLGQLMNNCSRVLEPIIILNMNIRVTVVESTCTQPANEQIKTVLVMFLGCSCNVRVSFFMKLTLNKEYSVSIEHPLGKVNPLFEYWTTQSTEVQAAERIQKPVGQTSEIENFSKLEFGLTEVLVN